MGKTWWVAAVASVVLSGCAFTDPGSGSKTLEFTMTLNYAGNGPDTTAVSMTRLTKAGLAVSNPSILVRDLQTGAGFPVTPPRGSLPGYHRNIQIDVTANNDALACKLEGPSRFSITQPLQAQTVEFKQDLQVKWRTPDGIRADTVAIHLENADVHNTLASDDGFYTIPAALLRAGNETVTVVRTTKVVPAGAAGSASWVEMRYVVSVDFLVQ